MKNILFITLFLIFGVCISYSSSSDYKTGYKYFLEGNKEKASIYFLKCVNDENLDYIGDYELANFLYSDARFSKLAHFEYTKFLENFFKDFNNIKFRKLSLNKQDELRNKVADAIFKRRRFDKTRLYLDVREYEVKVHHEGWKIEDINELIRRCKNYETKIKIDFLKDIWRIARAKGYAAKGDFENSNKVFNEYFDSLKKVIELLYPKSNIDGLLLDEYIKCLKLKFTYDLLKNDIEDAKKVLFELKNLKEDELYKYFSDILIQKDRMVKIDLNLDYRNYERNKEKIEKIIKYGYNNLINGNFEESNNAFKVVLLALYSW